MYHWRPPPRPAHAKPLVGTCLGSLVSADIHDELFPHFRGAFDVIPQEAPGVSAASPLLDKAEVRRHGSEAAAVAARHYAKLKPELDKGRRVHLVAHSMGGVVALHLAPRIADRHPGALAGIHLFAPVNQKRLLALSNEWNASTFLMASRPKLRTLMARKEVNLAPETFERLLENWRARQTPLAFAQQVSVALSQIPWDEVNDLPCPIEVVGGEEDHYFAPPRVLAEFAANMPHATHATVRGAGHFILTEQPRVARALVRGIHARELELAGELA
jgi:pimeloyl-ACP methyl ester carboxylesterase